MKQFQSISNYSQITAMRLKCQRVNVTKYLLPNGGIRWKTNTLAQNPIIIHGTCLWCFQSYIFFCTPSFIFHFLWIPIHSPTTWPGVRWLLWTDGKHTPEPTAKPYRNQKNRPIGTKAPAVTVATTCRDAKRCPRAKRPMLDSHPLPIPLIRRMRWENAEG